ncbi:hypothetical protein GDO86_014117 [Hymenochirus boettgeri]|uniref:SWIM-type domain-containing protein n=1 Tax=Hymenochirus boettgeri TaxID=247094 RepID=A0A8T2JT79_9PIPI|nr:hypothetical protein GDO86_014117 [Hymenochirus boettgeri]
MLLGSCFLTYEDFKARFSSYKRENHVDYMIESRTSVQQHNRTKGAGVRQDVKFTHVKFRCSQALGKNHKKSKKNPCPAYFILQYDDKLDCLLIKEEHSDHIHTEVTKNLAVNSMTPLEALEPLSKKLCKERVSQTEELCVSLDDINESPACGDSVMNLTQMLNKISSEDSGSRTSISSLSQQGFEHLGFQTSTMKGFFEKYPECLMLHRVPTKFGYVLYAFLVETKERGSKVVHISFIKKENPSNLCKMINVFQGFNPEWLKVKVIFTDMSFVYAEVLKQTFPSVQVLLSVYHMVRLIEQKLNGSIPTIKNLRLLIDDAIYNTTPEKLSLLAEKLQGKVGKKLYDYLDAHWFSCKMLWYMHVKKGLHSCRTYMDSLDILSSKISHLLENQTCMESTIQQFMENADGFNSKGMENPRESSLGSFKPSTGFSCKNKPIQCSAPLVSLISLVKDTELSFQREDNSKKTIETPDNCSFISYMPAAINSDSSKNVCQWLVKQVSVPNKEPNVQRIASTVRRPRNVTDSMGLSLWDHCSHVGFQLCINEWEVVKKTTHLIRANSDSISVQILEDPHQITKNYHSCSCYFNKRYQLPCRHILKILYTQKQPVEKAMVSHCFQKHVQPLCEIKILNRILQYTKDEETANDRQNKIKALTKEFSNILFQCRGANLEEKSSTLQNIMDKWRKQSNTVVDPQCVQSNSVEAPLRWVKREPLEGEGPNGCYVLCRLDTRVRDEMSMD